MPVKKHPFSQATTGTVFAIAIAAHKWGFLRFYRGLAMQVLPFVGGVPAMPQIDWNNRSPDWVFFSFAPYTDQTEAINLGVVPFRNEGEEWSPPCFDPPDVIENCYRIHHRGMVRKPIALEDVQGMNQCRTMTPAKLAQFLRERLEAGELETI